jgi:hypothetical protein
MPFTGGGICWWRTDATILAKVRSGKLTVLSLLSTTRSRCKNCNHIFIIDAHAISPNVSAHDTKIGACDFGRNGPIVKREFHKQKVMTCKSCDARDIARLASSREETGRHSPRSVHRRIRRFNMVREEMPVSLANEP